MSCDHIDQSIAANDVLTMVLAPEDADTVFTTLLWSSCQNSTTNYP